MSERSHTDNTRLSAARQVQDQPAAAPALMASLLVGFVAACVATTIVWQAGGGFSLCLLAYSLGGSITVAATALAQIAIPHRHKITRLIVSRRRGTGSATVFSL